MTTSQLVRPRSGKMIAGVCAALGNRFGISTGLRYLPGNFAKTDEVIALSRVAADSGGFYASHLREEGLGLFEGVGEAITIGRQQGNTIQLTEKNVSRRHARLFPDGDDRWVVEDLESTNGTFVNGARIQEARLRSGDTLTVGRIDLVVSRGH